LNLPETQEARLIAEGMKKCVWVRPQIVAELEYLEWTESEDLRQSQFTGLHENEKALNVTKGSGEG
jgi:bifunctional non-homologous end joining protein LigD